MKLPKYLKLIVLNIFFIILFICFLEFFMYTSTKNEMTKQLQVKQNMNISSRLPSKQKISYSLKVPVFNYDAEKKLMRKPIGINYKKGPIVLFGCSYTYGDGLKETNTFSYKLSRYTNRPVYNRSFVGWGPQHILYQLRRDDFYKEVKSPEYVIYTVMSDHLNRLFRYQYPSPFSYAPLRYKLVKGKFEEIHPLFTQISGMYTISYLQQFIEKNITMSYFNKDKNLDYFCQLMKESKRLLNKKYPNTKFVIFIYREYNDMFIDNESLQRRLKNNGFILIDSDELTPHLLLAQPGYKTIDVAHPSDKAWDLIVPKLAKKLNL